MVRKLLIAEDNKFTATQYKKFFESNGYKVNIFQDGKSCLEKYKHELRYHRIVLKNKSAPFDYVLLDQDMPIMNGSEVSAQIHKICPQQKIIFLSAYGQSIIDSLQSSKEGYLQIMQKPFSLDFLLKKITPKAFTQVTRTNQENNILTNTQNPETVR